MVGSVDEHFAQFPASLRRNARPEKDKDGEIKKSMEQILTDNLENMVEERLERYFEIRNQSPTKIIIYRDGLSEEQFNMCRDHELPALRAGISKFCRSHGKDEPPVILICAVKRNHCRFFKDTENKLSTNLLDKNGNPLPGTLVDSGITYADKDDFYLVSHRAIIGTARPAHYIVLENDLKKTVTMRDIAVMVSTLLSNILILLFLLTLSYKTNNLCTTFQRSTTQVGVCPPIYYADLAADRARCYVRDAYAPSSHVTHDAAWFNSDANFNLSIHGNIKHSMFYL